MMNYTGIVMILFGVVFAALFIRGKKKAEMARSWPTVDATIVRSTVHVEGTYNERSVSPRIEYTYQVAGKTLNGSTITFTLIYSESMANALIKKYPAGTTAKVHYNPDNPSESCIEPGASQLTNLVIVGSLVFALIGIALLVLAGN